jgi:transposase
VLQAIERFDLEVAHLAPTLPDCPLFRGLPGAGPVYAPRLLAAFGEQRERYRSAADVQKCAGLAPVTERSGHKGGVHWRQHCPQCLRQTFVEWAAQSIPHPYWARALYEQQRATGSAHQAALRALAFKWIRILYRCWQDRTPYDGVTYLTALKRRGSPLLRAVQESSESP